MPTTPHPSTSPLEAQISSTLSSSDYDTVCVPLTNPRWQERWERLCLRPVEEELDPASQAALTRDLQREIVDREADVWRKEGGLRRNELNISRLEETQGLIAVASEWLEMDSSDEGIRFDSELVCLPPSLGSGPSLMYPGSSSRAIPSTILGYPDTSPPSTSISQPGKPRFICSSYRQSSPPRRLISNHRTLYPNPNIRPYGIDKPGPSLPFCSRPFNICDSP